MRQVTFSDEKPILITVSGRGPKGRKGDHGDAATIEIGTVTTLPAGSQATVENVGTEQEAMLNFGIPEGTKGNPGTPGTDGITPSVNVTEISGGHNVAFDYGTGDSRNRDFNVMDGQSGASQWGDLTGNIENQTDLKNALDDKADIIIAEASGDIVSISNAGAYPAEDVTVQIEHVQDLHGQDAPYPAGGGKNLLCLTGRRIITSNPVYDTTPRDFSEPSAYIGISGNNYFNNNKVGNYSISESSITVEVVEVAYGVGLTVKVSPSTQYVISYKNKDFNYIAVGFYDVDGNYLSFQNMNNAEKWTFTTPANCVNAIVVFKPKASGETKTYEEPQLELGSSATSYAPYSNVCPISGWTGANVTATGRNLIKQLVEIGGTSTQTYFQEINVNNGKISAWHLEAGKTYTLSMDITSSVTPFKLSVGCGTGNFTRDILNTGSYSSGRCSITFTPTASNISYGDILALRCPRYDVKTDYTYSITNLQLEEGDTATPYQSFGNTYTVSWQSEAGTVYGGELDVTTGLLTVNRALYRLPRITSISVSNQGYIKADACDGWMYPDPEPYPSVGASIQTNDYYSNTFKFVKYGTWATTGYANCWCMNNKQLHINIANDLLGITDYTQETTETAKAKIIAYLNGLYDAGQYVEFVYGIEPQTYQLSPVEIALLMKDNNIWADTGSSSVRYKADTKTYVDERSIDPTDIYAELANKAPLASPNFSGTPKVPNISNDTTSNLQIANTAFVQTIAKRINAELAFTETSMKVTRNYTAGDLIAVSNKLYIALSNITSGATLTNNSNVSETTIDAQMKRKANAADLGGLATKDAADYETEVTNKPNLYDKADVILSSAEGDIASFPDGAPAPVVSMTVDIDPVQDLHGYSNPWPAGGGKNLVNWTGPQTITSQTTIVTFDTSKQISYTASMHVVNNGQNSAALSLFAYNGNSLVNYKQTSLPVGANGRYSVTNDLSEATYTQLRIVISGSGSGYSVTVKDAQLEEGETASDFAPYSNLCPISGFTGASIQRTGKNLFALNGQMQKWVDSSGIVGGGTTGYNTNVMSVKPNQAYTISTGNASDTYTLVMAWYDANGSFIGRNLTYVNNSTTSATITAPSNARTAIFGISCREGAMSLSVLESLKPQLELGSSASAYEPYSGTTYPVSWQSEAGTVYGGSLNPVTGLLTMDRASVSLTGDAIAHYWDDSGRDSMGFYSQPSEFNAKYPTPSEGSGIFDYCKTGAVYNNDNIWTARIFFHEGSFNRFEIRIPKSVLSSLNLSGGKAYLDEHPLQAVYKVEPQTYQLSPTDVQTLLGDNRIWSDTGSCSVQYRADTRRFIEKLTQPSEDDMTANENIPSGKFFMVGNTLYYSTSAISAGTTIVPDGNCTRLSLADALNNLNS